MTEEPLPITTTLRWDGDDLVLPTTRGPVIIARLMSMRLDDTRWWSAVDMTSSKPWRICSSMTSRTDAWRAVVNYFTCR